MQPTSHFHLQWTIEFPINAYRGCLTFSPSGDLLAGVTGMTERDKYGRIQRILGSEIIRVWDASTGQEVYTLTGHVDRVHKLLFTSDEQHLISSSDDSTIRVWDFSMQREMQVMSGHEGVISGLAFGSDEQWLVSSACNRYVSGEYPDERRKITNDRTLRFWDWRNGVEVDPLNEESAGFWHFRSDTFHVAFCADGETFLTSHFRSVPGNRLWHLPSQKQIGSLQEFHTDGWIDQTLHQTLLYSWKGVYCLETDQYIFNPNLRKSPDKQDLYSYTVDPNRRFFVGSVGTRGYSPGVGLSESFELAVWHLDTGQRIGSINRDFARGENLVFSQDGNMLAGWLCMFKLPDTKNKLQLWKVTDALYR